MNAFRLLCRCVLGWLVVGGMLSPAAAQEPSAILDAWIAAQNKISTWQANFTQTRTLKTLTSPLVTPGQLWFAAPAQFRWELGTPPQTIAVRQPEQLLVIYPRLRRVERFPLTGETGSWREVLAMIEAGFPRSRAALDAQYRVLGLERLGENWQVNLQPRSAAARRFLSEVKIAFAAADYSLRATELRFADGSTMRNDFRQPQVNPAFPPDLFQPAIGPEYKVVEPTKERR